MAGMTEACSVCGRHFDVQFRYQMEEKDGGFAFFCSQDCQGRSMRGEDAGGVTCDACGKRFALELVSQVVRVKSGRKYACADACRAQVLAEADGARLGQLVEPLSAAPTSSEAATLVAAAPPPAATPMPPPATALGVAAAAAVPTAAAAHAPPPVAAMFAGAPTAPATAPPASAAVPAGSAARAVRRGAKLYGPRRLAIFNHKGGTGKTTTSVSVASGLAARGLRVLLVDTDSQGNVGVSLAVKAEKSLYHVLVMGIRPQDAAVNVRNYPEKGGALDLIVSNETLAAAELYLAGRQNRDRVLQHRLAQVADQYDVVMLDCSPSLSLMNQNAMVTAEGILVPVACDFLSLVGVRQVLKTVKNVNSLLHHPVQIFGVLPTFYDARARICRDALDTMKEHFGERCLPPIRATIKVKEAPAQGRTIYEYAADSNAAEDYRRVVDFIVDGPSALRATGGGSATTDAGDDDAQLAAG